MERTVKHYHYNGNAGPKAAWLERRFNFGQPPNMLVFFLERMQGAVARMNAKVEDVSDAILSDQRDGKWSVKQNIGHLAEVEEISLKRVDEILRGVPIMSSAIFPVKHDYNAMPVGDVIALFERSRLATLEVYDALDVAALAITSIHPRFKVPMNAVDLALFHAEHDDHHLLRITEIINTRDK
jgi:hypothetical protein